MPRLAFACLLLLLVAAPARAQQPTTDQVRTRIEQAYRSTRTLQATFTQTVGGSTFSGTLQMSGDRFRIEMDGQTLVSDGESAWSYSPSDNVVMISRLEDDDAMMSPSQFFLTYPERFNIQVTGRESVGGVTVDVLRLTPKNAGDAVQEATLHIRASDAIPTRVSLRGANGSTVLLILRNIQLNAPLPDSTFQFTPPAGAEVIDLRRS